MAGSGRSQHGRRWPAAAVAAQPSPSARGQEGGSCVSPSLRLQGSTPSTRRSRSPSPGWSLLDTTCARLFTYPDKPPPAAFRLQPEVVAGWKVSNDFKTYTFRLRHGFRFSDGKQLQANAFAHAINRVLQLGAASPGRIFMRDIVGAADVSAGRARSARGVVARGMTLTVRLTQPAPDFPLERPSPTSARSHLDCRRRARAAARFRRPAPSTSRSTARTNAS